MAEDGGEGGQQADEEEGPLVQVGVQQVVHVDPALEHRTQLIKPVPYSKGYRYHLSLLCSAMFPLLLIIEYFFSMYSNQRIWRHQRNKGDGFRRSSSPKSLFLERLIYDEG